jgi:hypothetical protein
MQVKETDLPFCRFWFNQAQSSDKILITTVKKKDLDDIIGPYALMLPFKKKGTHAFQAQYSVCYPEWHTLSYSSTGPS